MRCQRLKLFYTFMSIYSGTYSIDFVLLHQGCLHAISIISYILCISRWLISQIRYLSLRNLKYGRKIWLNYGTTVCSTNCIAPDMVLGIGTYYIGLGKTLSLEPTMETKVRSKNELLITWFANFCFRGISKRLISFLPKYEPYHNTLRRPILRTPASIFESQTKPESRKTEISEHPRSRQDWP